MTSGQTNLLIFKRKCLLDEELYNYLTGTRGARATGELEAHLTECAACRRELADLINVLHPENEIAEEPAPALSPAELAQTLETVQVKGKPDQPLPAAAWPWYRWASVAAAAVLMVGLSALVLTRVLQNRRADEYFQQARLALEQVYAPQSPAGLRLDLPFRAGALQRSPGAEDESLRNAERLFYQALALREKYAEAQLGLAYVHLKKAEYVKAGDEFQRILEVDGAHWQARLGRGVSNYETGLAAKDPLERIARLESAVADFDLVLKEKPECSEAAFNRILALYDLGRHQEALQQIDIFLQREPQSPWADRLRDLKTRMLLNRAEAVEKEIHSAAVKHDQQALLRLARSIPYRMSAAIRATMRGALQASGEQAAPGAPDASSLRWAADTLDFSYRSASGDFSGQQLFRFYESLSPAGWSQKKNWTGDLRS